MRAALSRRELRLWISAKNILSAQRNRIDEIRLASGTPPPPRSIGIISVAGNSEVIPGHQSLAGKIFTIEELRARTFKIPGSPGFAIMDSFWVRRKVRCHSVTLWNLAFMLAHWFYGIVEMRSLQTQGPCVAKATAHRVAHLPQPRESRGIWAPARIQQQSSRRQ